MGDIVEFRHVTVLAEEAVLGLNVQAGKVYLDGTLGGAGHSILIAERLAGKGSLICLDQDQIALDNASVKLQEYQAVVKFHKSNFKDIDKVLLEEGLAGVDGILLDLGVSSPQLDTEERGFSYNHNAKLDMRMDQHANKTAEDVVNEYSEQELAKIIFKYGEEKFSKAIARNIVKTREKKIISTTLELVDIIKESIPAPARRSGPHPAKRTFQAIRIEVNDELAALETVIEKGLELLLPGGRYAIITFHSLEDRIVKQAFKAKIKTCSCPPNFPQCVCGFSNPKAGESLYKLLTKKPIEPSEQEIIDNPRARSAKLRIIEKCNIIGGVDIV